MWARCSPWFRNEYAIGHLDSSEGRSRTSSLVPTLDRSGSCAQLHLRGTRPLEGFREDSEICAATAGEPIRDSWWGHRKARQSSNFLFQRRPAGCAR
jgi:hypothetical protein